MSCLCSITNKLQKLTCDKVRWNRRFLKWHKCLKEAQKALDDSQACSGQKKH